MPTPMSIPAALRLMGLAGLGLALACAPMRSPSSDGSPSSAASPSRAVPTADDALIVRDQAAAEVVRLKSILAEAHRSCRLTGPGRITGRDRGYFLDWGRLLAVQTNSYRRDVVIEPVDRLPFDTDLPPMTVVIPPSVRGTTVHFAVDYVSEDVAGSASVTPTDYSMWEVLLSQLVTMYEYPYSCAPSTSPESGVVRIGVWDGLRLAAYPNRESPPRIIAEVPLR